MFRELLSQQWPPEWVPGGLRPDEEQRSNPGRSQRDEIGSWEHQYADN